jgi:tetratricopeptide (TPR) repeat protein
MPPPIFAIFVSSTWEDLKPEREAVFNALRKHPQLKFIGMEDSGCRNENTLQGSLQDVHDSNVYVGIIGGRYASGITEKEYRAACELELPRFIYFKSAAALLNQPDELPWPKLQLPRFKQQLRENHTIKEFDSPEELAFKVFADLNLWCAAETSDRASRSKESSVHQLHSPIGNFVGRQQEINRLMKALTPAPFTRLALISGMGGIGKTELARRVAHDLSSLYPDVQLLIELGSHGNAPIDTIEALKRAIVALQISDRDLPENLAQLTKIYRSLLDGKRALVMLDDAADSAQVTALTPPAGCALLVTSRKRMALPAMEVVPLGQLGAYESSQLLRSFESQIEPEIAGRISQLCGFLPLALRHAGSLLSVNQLDPKAYLERLHDERTRLEKFDSEDVEISVKATFNLSYRHLTVDSSRVFRQLAVFAGHFDEQAEDAVCDDAAAAQLKQLASLSLVLKEEKGNRYRLHDLVRIYAGQLLVSSEQNIAAYRHSEYYLSKAQQAGKLYQRGGESTRRGLDLFELEWDNLRAGRTWSDENSTTSEDIAAWCLHYVDWLKYLLRLRRSPGEQIAWLQAAFQISRRLSLRDLEGGYLSGLGLAYSSTGELQKAEDYFQRALAIAREVGDRLSEGNVQGNLGNLLAKTDPSTAIEHYHECLRILYELDQGRAAGNTLNNLANAYVNLGQRQRAIEYYNIALSVAREVQDPVSEGAALSNLGNEYADEGLSNQAIDSFNQALAILEEAGDWRGQVATLCNLGNAYVDLPDIPGAIQLYQQALKISRGISDPSSICMSLSGLGHAYYKFGDNKLALDQHNQSLQISIEIEDLHSEGLIRWNIAQVLHEDKNLPAGILQAERALAILEEIGHPKAGVVREALAAWRQAKQSGTPFLTQDSQTT